MMTTSRSATIYEGDASTLAQMRERLARMEAVQAELEALHLDAQAAEVGLHVIALRFSSVRGWATCMGCLAFHQTDVSVGGDDSLDFQPCQDCP